MYKLTLTYTDRSAIDLIGNRYAHGDELYELLIVCDQTIEHAHDNGDDTWTGRDDITFHIPESTAWRIKDIIEQDNLACFAPALVCKMQELSDKII